MNRNEDNQVAIEAMMQEIYGTNASISSGQKARFIDILSELSEREGTLLSMYYGLHQKKKSILEISAYFEVKEVTVQKVIDEAVKKLRSPSRKARIFGVQ